MSEPYLIPLMLIYFHKNVELDYEKIVNIS